MTRRTLIAVPLAAALALAACTADPGEATTAGESGTTAEPTTPAPVVSEPVAPAETAVLAGETATALSAETSRTFFAAAPLAVVGTPETALQASSLALTLGAPVLIDEPAPAGDEPAADSATADATDGAADQDGDAAPDATAQELDRLGTATVIAVGDADLAGSEGVDVVPAPADEQALAELVGTDLTAQAVPEGEEVAAVAALDPEAPILLVHEAPADDATGETTESTDGTTATADGTTATADAATNDPTQEASTSAAAALPPSERPEPIADGVVVMSTGETVQAAAVANARTAGAAVQLVPTGDPRASSQTVQETAANAPEVVVGLGPAFGDAGTLAWRTSTAATGTELPGGGQLALPGKTYVALYGTPGSGALGVLGEQDVPATVQRAAEHAEPYRALTDTQLVPALEIIASVASAGAGEDGNYSAERSVDQLRPLVEAAHENGQYVVLDLQPGRTDFLTQAKRYEELLKLPNVGLALDPEWRLRPDQVHLRQIGQVDVAEVNRVVTWLADLTRANNLPQKILVLHQFQVRMIPGVNEVDQSRSELAVLVHVDGQGAQGDKQTTWRTLRGNAPNVRHWGWKNFYDEDVPMLTPEQTMQVEPRPAFISYQ
ncbi:hypothetical protein KZX45_03025 [Georgenia sp. EYE_87]|uniref:hypothetical protein n=1 Tax=Georgenia sp. EYE_87 TaxID=2853448 RepID=UPI002003DA5D|nr:hypothetical protein [Georgenia sp. EYE_87]MCK6209514.1 hypothetical protein [Georgenia sp. EYE_87]